MMCAVLLLLGAARAAPPTVAVPGLGSIEGVFLRGNVSSQRPTNVSGFYGIPYAQPPVGDLRWRPPRHHGPWASPRNASRLGSACPQVGMDPGKMDEACLFLNVFTPSSALEAGSRLPVMFWIHGGSFRTGSSNDFIGTGILQVSNLSVVLVTVNYRLNVFGFLGGRGLRPRSGDGSTGNFGIQDQRLALEWVRDHIGAFGGDGADITIFGESAGGLSVLNHLTQPASFPLYTKAIIESGTYDGIVDFAEAEFEYAALLTRAGCFPGTLECLLRLSANELVKLGHVKSRWGPVVDGVSLTENVFSLLRRGVYNNKVPVMLGSNSDEDAYFFVVAHSPPATMNEATLDAFLADTVGRDKVKEVRELYDASRYSYPAKLGNFSQHWWTALRVSTDRVPGLGPCGARSVARSLAAGGTPSVFVYFFGHPTQGNSVIPGTGPGSVVVPHASEIQYVYADERVLQEGGESELALVMSSYWSSFAVAGNPNEHWSAYARESDSVLVLKTVGEGGIEMRAGLRKEACDYWDRQHQEKKSVEASVGTPIAV